MKSKEEVQQLATQDFNDRQECGHYELADLKSRDYYYDGFFNGYTQCQEDMADKKYTEEDMIDVFNFLSFNNKSFSEFKEFINSLNKQD